MNINNIKEDTVLLTPISFKKKILKESNEKKQIIKGRIYDLQTFMKEYRGEYDPVSLYEIMKEEKVSPSLASIYLSFLDKIGEDYQDEKIVFLNSIKEKLNKKNLFYKNPFFLSFLEGKKILLYGYKYISKEEKKFIEEISIKYEVTQIEEERPLKKVYYQQYNTVEEELASVAEQITILLKDGTEISTIKLFIPNETYKKEIHRIFESFHIPYQLNERKSLLSYDMPKYFLSLLEETEPIESLEIIKETYDLKKTFQKEIYQSMVQTITPFLEVSKEIELFTYLLQEKMIACKEYRNCVEEIKSLEEGEGFIVFALGISLGTYPKIYKENDFLNEKQKKLLQIETAKEKNKRAKEIALEAVSIPTTLHITYAEKSLFTEYATSSIIKNLEEKKWLIEEKKVYSFTSYSYNQYLLSKELDSFTKYGQKSKTLQLLNPIINVPYKVYTHQYKPISKQLLHQYLDHSLVLSYSSIELFYKCPFRFYISHILKIRENVESTSIIIGNIVHKVLYLLFKEPDREEKLVDDVLDEYYKKESMTPKISFYKEKYKKEILKLISIIKDQKNNSDFEETYLEKEFSTIIEGDCTVTIKGYIDKVLTFTDEKNTYVIVVDYKTGVITPNFNPVIYGMNMQLLVYYYLLLKSNPKYLFAGSYWQNIMKDVLPSEKGKTYDTLLKEAYKLNGYTVKNANIVGHIDLEVENSFIKSLKLKKDGEFYSYSKVLDVKEIEFLVELTEKNIENAVQKIENASFTISPKKIGNEKTNEITGCKYCSYRDICFKEPTDSIALKEYKNLEFIKEMQYE